MTLYDALAYLSNVYGRDTVRNFLHPTDFDVSLVNDKDKYLVILMREASVSHIAANELDNFLRTHKITSDETKIYQDKSKNS